MTIYYYMKFRTDRKPEGICLDAITFDTRNGARYVVDVTGENDVETLFADGICTVDGRVKGDCDSVMRLDPQNINAPGTSFEEIPYTELFELIQSALLETMRFTLCDEDGGEISDLILYEVEILLNGCPKILFRSQPENCYTP